MFFEMIDFQFECRYTIECPTPYVALLTLDDNDEFVHTPYPMKTIKGINEAIAFGFFQAKDGDILEIAELLDGRKDPHRNHYVVYHDRMHYISYAFSEELAKEYLKGERNLGYVLDLSEENGYLPFNIIKP